MARFFIFSMFFAAFFCAHGQDFKFYTPIGDISQNSITSISQDDKGFMWFGTRYCVNRYEVLESGKQELRHFFAADEARNTITSNYITGILEDDQGNILIGTWGGGLCVYNPQKDQITAYRNDQNPIIPPDNIIRSLYKSKSGHIWAGTHHGIFSISSSFSGAHNFQKNVMGEVRLYNQLDQSVILSIIEDTQSRLWVGTENEGLFFFDLKRETLTQYQHDSKDQYSLSSNSIWSLFEDKHGTIWIGTYKNGISKIDPLERKFQHISDGFESKHSISYGLVSAFAEDVRGNIWIGTDGGGLNYLERKGKFDIQSITHPTFQGLESDIIVCLMHDQDQQFWVGTWGDGLFVKTNTSDVFKPFMHESRAKSPSIGKEILDIYQSANGDIWISPYREGLDLYVPSEQRLYHFTPSVQNNSISSRKNRSIIADAEGYVWLGTEDEGLDRIQLNDQHQIIEIKNYQTNEGDPTRLSSNTINCLFIDSKGQMWIGTEGNGLNKYNPEQDNFEQMTVNQGLPGNVVFGMLDDGEYLWVSTNVGLASIHLENGATQSYDVTDGLQSNEFSKSAAFKTKNGIFLFGGNNGFNYFDPKEIQKNKTIPPVYITGVSLQNATAHSEIQEDIHAQFSNGKIDLTSQQNDLTFQFSGLNFTQASKNKYFVKISISDTGIGISADQLHLIFNRYFRAKNTNNNVGTGIGLSLSKQLVELHKGIIEVNSIEGQGTTFDLYLREAKDHLEPDQIYELEDVHELSEDSVIELKDFKINAQDAEVFPENDENHMPVVLIMEDNPDLRAFTRSYLQMNYQIQEAENGRQAFELAKKHIPDIIITDVMMPEVNGIELAKMIRGDERTSHIFIIMLTVKSSDQSKEEGFEAGVDYYISKPFNPKLLDLRIQNILSTRGKFKQQMLKNNISLTPDLKAVTISSKDEEFINKILACIDKNLSNSKFGVIDICKEIGFSKSQLYRKLKGLMDQSANEFIRSIRLKRAGELLMQKELSVAQITYKVGFNDLQYFRSCFKNQYGMTPTDYIAKETEQVKI